jgi:hypothetical protein
MLVFSAFACALPLIIGYAWVVYSDSIKLLNPLGALFTSDALTKWNFGTLNQRFSVQLWDAIVRALHDIFGYYSVFIAIIACVAALKTRLAVYVVAAGIGFLMPFFLFTNLHIVHNYYQYANAIFALAAVGMALAGFVQAGRPIVAILLLGVISIGQLLFFHSRYVGLIQADYSKADAYRIALQAKKEVPPDKGLLVLGQDFSSVINYYSERKGVALPIWAPKFLVQKLFDDPDPFFGDKPLGAIVYCPDPLTPYLESAPLVEAYLAGRKELGEAGKCKLLSVSR